MKVLLLFPPQFLPISPFAGTAYLTSYLKNNGINVVQEDLNAEMYDYFLSTQCLDALEKRAKKRLQSCNTADDLVDLSHLLLEIDESRTLIREAKNNLKSTDTYSNPCVFSQSVDAVGNVLKLISRSHAPTTINLCSYFMPGAGSADDIVAFFRKRDVSWLFLKFLEKRIAQYIKKHKPDIIGLSVGDRLELPLAIAALIKRKHPDIYVVLGGPGATVGRDLLKSNPDYFDLFDYLIIHDGELAFHKLIQTLRSDHDVSQVPNLIYKDPSTGDITETPSEPLNLHDVSPPDFSNLNLNKYLVPETIFPIQIGRGCYWNKCTFCDRLIAFSQNKGDSYRSKSISQVLKEIKYIKRKYGARYIYFTDEAIPVKYLEELSQAIINNNISIKWMGLTRFENDFKKTTFFKLKKSGCVKLGFGLESACKRILYLMNKGIVFDKAKKIIGWANEAKIPLHIWLMIGFPSETKREIRNTMNVFKDLIPLLDVPGFSFAISDFVLDHYSQINLNASYYGIKKRVKNPKLLYHFYKYFCDTTNRNTRQLIRHANKYRKEIKIMLKHPELINREYITGFLWGMFISGQNMARNYKCKKEVGKCA